MLACLIAPFLLGLFWRRSTSTAALVSAGVGLTVRLVFLALVPTLYGVPNDLFYIDNSLLDAGFDGWATLVAAVVSVVAFVVTALLTRSHDEEEIDLRSADRTLTAA